MSPRSDSVPTASVPARRRRRWAGFLLRLFFTLALLAFALTRIDLVDLAGDLGRSAWWGPVGAGLLLLVNLGLQWARWHLLARTGGLPLTPPGTLRMLLAGLALGLVTPGRMGEIGRGAVVPGDHDALSVAGLTALERAIGMLGALGLALGAMIASGYGHPGKWIPLLALYGVLGLVLASPRHTAGVLTLLGPRLPGPAAAGLRTLGNRLLQGWRLAGSRAVLTVLLISVAQTAVVITQLSICYLAAAGPLDPLKVAGAWAAVLGAKYLLPVTVGDLGVREGLAVLIFADRMLPASPALAAALTIYAFNVLGPALIGALLLLQARRSE